MNDVETPRHEPEILPPKRAGSGRPGFEDGRFSASGSIRVFRMGPLGLGLIGLAVASVLLVILFLFAGFLLVIIPAVVISIIIAGLLARFRR